MRKNRFSEEQIIYTLQGHEPETKTADKATFNGLWQSCSDESSALTQWVER